MTQTTTDGTMSDPKHLSEVKSTAYPKLERVPGKQNWVDYSGGLPSYIERIAKHLHYEKGFPIGRAIAIAVNVVKRWATAGNVTTHSGHQVTAATRAKAAAAVAEWEAKKVKGSAAMHAHNLKESEAQAVDRILSLHEFGPDCKGCKNCGEDALNRMVEADVLELVAEPVSQTQRIEDALVRFHRHPRNLAAQLAENTMNGEDGIVMTPEEKASVREGLNARWDLLEGIATSLTSDDARTRAVAVATGYQFLSGGRGSVNLNEVAPVDDDQVRGLFAQLAPEMDGLREALELLEACGAFKGGKRVKGAKLCKKGTCKNCDAHSMEEAKRGERKSEPVTPPADTSPATDGGIAGEQDSERVKHLQARLDSLGFDTKVDGDFGPKTHECVKQFQLHSGLVRDGVVGPKTTEMLQKAPHPSEMENTLDEAEADEPVIPSVLRRGLGIGLLSDPNVTALQESLATVGYTVEADGRFGAQTEQTVKRFQRKYGLTADGEVGVETRWALDGVTTLIREITEASIEQELAEDASAWQAARDREAALREDLALSESRGWLHARPVPTELREATERGAARAVVRELLRLPNGTFAPKGSGQVLRPGDHVRLPDGHKGIVSPVGTVKDEKGKVTSIGHVGFGIEPNKPLSGGGDWRSMANDLYNAPDDTHNKDRHLALLTKSEKGAKATIMYREGNQAEWTKGDKHWHSETGMKLSPAELSDQTARGSWRVTQIDQHPDLPSAPQSPGVDSKTGKIVKDAKAVEDKAFGDKPSPPKSPGTDYHPFPVQQGDALASLNPPLPDASKFGPNQGSISHTGALIDRYAEGSDRILDPRVEKELSSMKPGESKMIGDARVEATKSKALYGAGQTQYTIPGSRSEGVSSPASAAAAIAAVRAKASKVATEKGIGYHEAMREVQGKPDAPKSPGVDPKSGKVVPDAKALEDKAFGDKPKPPKSPGVDPKSGKIVPNAKSIEDKAFGDKPAPPKSPGTDAKYEAAAAGALATFKAYKGDKTSTNPFDIYEIPMPHEDYTAVPVGGSAKGETPIWQLHKGDLTVGDPGTANEVAGAYAEAITGKLEPTPEPMTPKERIAVLRDAPVGSVLAHPNGKAGWTKQPNGKWRGATVDGRTHEQAGRYLTGGMGGVDWTTPNSKWSLKSPPDAPQSPGVDAKTGKIVKDAQSIEDKAFGDKKLPAPPKSPGTATHSELAGHSVSDLASEIQKDWGAKVNFAAKPYLEAMQSLHSLDDSYGVETGRDIVPYFLANASSWHGPKAKAVKAELKARLKMKPGEWEAAKKEADSVAADAVTPEHAGAIHWSGVQATGKKLEDLEQLPDGATVDLGGTTWTAKTTLSDGRVWEPKASDRSRFTSSELLDEYGGKFSKTDVNLKDGGSSTTNYSMLLHPSDYEKKAAKAADAKKPTFPGATREETAAVLATRGSNLKVAIKDLPADTRVVVPPHNLPGIVAVNAKGVKSVHHAIVHEDGSITPGDRMAYKASKQVRVHDHPHAVPKEGVPTGSTFSAEPVLGTENKIWKDAAKATEIGGQIDNFHYDGTDDAGALSSMPQGLRDRINEIAPGKSNTVGGVKVTRQADGAWNVDGDANLASPWNVVQSLQSKRGSKEPIAAPFAKAAAKDAKGSKEPAAWTKAKKDNPNDPVFPDGKPFMVRVQEIEKEGATTSDAQSAAEVELQKAGVKVPWNEIPEGSPEGGPPEPTPEPKDEKPKAAKPKKAAAKTKKAAKAPAGGKTATYPAEANPESDLTDNIGPDAKNVEDLVPGQKMMLSDGNIYHYHKQANPTSPFHIIAPAGGWYKGHPTLKAKPMHGLQVPVKIGPVPGEEPPKKSLKAEADKAASELPTSGESPVDKLQAEYTKIKDGDASPENLAKLNDLWGKIVDELGKDSPEVKDQLSGAAPHAGDSKWKPADPKSKALDVYLATGGKDPAIIQALKVQEASGLSFDEALAIVEAAGEDF